MPKIPTNDKNQIQKTTEEEGDEEFQAAIQPKSNSSSSASSKPIPPTKTIEKTQKPSSYESKVIGGKLKFKGSE